MSIRIGVGDGVVLVRIGDGQFMMVLTPEEARAVAAAIVEGAEAAQGDAQDRPLQ